MQIDIAPQAVEILIDNWRDGVDMKAPMLDEFKIHMMQNRRSILNNHARAAGAWNLLLSCATPVGDGAEFEQLRAKIRAFQDWAKTELAKLDAL
ncbi:hypothetical protein K2O51_31530 (plasmid) [Cupriavidus pinatubonensis]|uniref:hypothetical protein n=1 Tax=Cupriavidus pinatubonensis TaxID=248026 RepID=UPI001C731170|nr:hypothetical protein [Cupriavidus pinatubonensis]QYY33563.1 hypothetical protein K2O51_31530 [Cupriavidus pinatubonensis]